MKMPFLKALLALALFSCGDAGVISKSCKNNHLTWKTDHFTCEDYLAPVVLGGAYSRHDSCVSDIGAGGLKPSEVCPQCLACMMTKSPLKYMNSELDDQTLFFRVPDVEVPVQCWNFARDTYKSLESYHDQCHESFEFGGKQVFVVQFYFPPKYEKEYTAFMLCPVACENFEAAQLKAVMANTKVLEQTLNTLRKRLPEKET